MDLSDRPPTRAAFPFFERRTARYNEIDGQGIVFNARYLDYVNLAAAEYMLTIAPDFYQWRRTTGCDVNAVHATLDWRAPLHLGEAFIVGIRADKLGRSAIHWRCAIFRTGEDAPSADGRLIWVYADQSARESRPLPGALRAAIEAKEGA